MSTVFAEFKVIPLLLMGAQHDKSVHKSVDVHKLFHLKHYIYVTNKLVNA